MRRHILQLSLIAFVFIGFSCESVDGSEATTPDQTKQQAEQQTQQGEQDMVSYIPDKPVVPDDIPEGMKVATLAGGCFWCVEADFQKLDGVKAAISGYCGGKKDDPKYKEVASGQTRYTETVQIIYDPDVVTYEELLHRFWRVIDPTDFGGQFVDRGPQYRPVIFYHNDEQKRLAEESKKELEKNGPFDEPIVVKILPATKFWKAKEYHQDFFKTNSERYNSYRSGSGRDDFIEKHWGDN
jgi:peptide methionine sulfoxide reductase msrA/msrB